MIKHVLAIAISAALLAAIPLGTVAAQTAPAAQSTPAKAEKKLTPQQQKMKDCGAKWQEEKKTKNVKGREAYRKFLSTCLKG